MLLLQRRVLACLVLILVAVLSTSSPGIEATAAQEIEATPVVPASDRVHSQEATEINILNNGDTTSYSVTLTMSDGGAVPGDVVICIETMITSTEYEEECSEPGETGLSADMPGTYHKVEVTGQSIISESVSYRPSSQSSYTYEFTLERRPQQTINFEFLAPNGEPLPDGGYISIYFAGSFDPQTYPIEGSTLQVTGNQGSIEIVVTVPGYALISDHYFLGGSSPHTVQLNLTPLEVYPAIDVTIDHDGSSPLLPGDLVTVTVRAEGTLTEEVIKSAVISGSISGNATIMDGPECEVFEGAQASPCGDAGDSQMSVAIAPASLDGWFFDAGMVFQLQADAINEGSIEIEFCAYDTSMAYAQFCESVTLAIQEPLPSPTPTPTPTSTPPTVSPTPTPAIEPTSEPAVTPAPTSEPTSEPPVTPTPTADTTATPSPPEDATPTVPATTQPSTPETQGQDPTAPAEVSALPSTGHGTPKASLWIAAIVFASAGLLAIAAVRRLSAR